MSRRPNPAADRAAQNQQTIKSLLKLEGNKSCADCKRNKRRSPPRAAEHHRSVSASCAEADWCLRTDPRWASWNLGIFVCIRYARNELQVEARGSLFARCSGIHRGMGTHISRVKSVDLDSWTDEQLQSVLRWGNARANKFVLCSGGPDVQWLTESKVLGSKAGAWTCALGSVSTAVAVTYTG